VSTALKEWARAWTRRSMVACAIVMFSLPAVAGAQTDSVAGSVRDESGLAVPDANVRLVLSSGGERTTTTDRNGDFGFARVPAGEARVFVRIDGFRPAQQAVVVRGGGQLRVDIVLAVAGFTDAVVVTASRDERPMGAVSSSATVLSGATVEAARSVNLTELLQFVAGVTAGDVSGVDDRRISIRGAGIRAGFGSRGVILMADGYPITEPDGQTPHFDGQIDLTNAERIEVVKGPSSAMYGGAALGGVVNVVSRTPGRAPHASMRVEGGSFAFGKAHISASSGAGPFVVSGTLGYTHLDGFRAHNSLEDLAGTARLDWSGQRSRVTLSMLGTQAALNLPGTLSRAQMTQDPAQVRPIYVTNDWGRENTVVRFGGKYETQLGSAHLFEVDSYGQLRDLFHPIFVVIDQDARRYVGHARYRYARGAHVLAVGVDADAQQVDDRWHVNVGGQPGMQIRDDENLLTNVGVYAQEELALGTRAIVTAGVRMDTIRYDLGDRMPADGDASDVRLFRRVSPKAGLTFAVRNSTVLYGNVATGFEAPTLGELRLPSGLNADVRPQKAVSTEVGLRGDAGRLSFDAAVYRMVVDDEILPETIDNVTVYRNVARAVHTGLETSLRLRPLRPLTVEGTYAYSRFVLDEFGAFSGNRLPGVPAHAGSVRAAMASGRWDGHAAVVWAGPTFVSDANTERANAYGVISGGVGYRLGRVRLFARGENLGDVRYTNRVQVNDASGFFYYPAPGRHGSGGAEVRW
jgi:iron complex outermembrane recepter protein